MTTTKKDKDQKPVEADTVTAERERLEKIEQSRMEHVRQIARGNRQ